jgi:hypothetical protein
VNKIDHLTTGGRKCEQVIACLGRRAVVEAFEQPGAAAGDGEMPSANQNKAFDRRVRGGEIKTKGAAPGLLLGVRGDASLGQHASCISNDAESK